MRMTGRRIKKGIGRARRGEQGRCQWQCPETDGAHANQTHLCAVFHVSFICRREIRVTRHGNKGCSNVVLFQECGNDSGGADGVDVCGSKDEDERVSRQGALENLLVKIWEFVWWVERHGSWLVVVVGCGLWLLVVGVEVGRRRNLIPLALRDSKSQVQRPSMLCLDVD